MSISIYNRQKNHSVFHNILHKRNVMSSFIAHSFSNILFFAFFLSIWHRSSPVIFFTFPFYDIFKTTCCCCWLLTLFPFKYSFTMIMLVWLKLIADNTDKNFQYAIRVPDHFWLCTGFDLYRQICSLRLIGIFLELLRECMCRRFWLVTK